MSTAVTGVLPRSPRAAPSASRLVGLDGLRGIAVAMVVAFHLWPDLVPGGFVGVSTFFTLSGFVITRGLLLEHQRTGGIALRRFWGRRLRRLWPASWVTLASVGGVWLATGWMTRSIGGDLAASFGQVANWRYLLLGDAYGEGALSPFTHFWSLAIEEQMYLVVPFVVWWLRGRVGWLLAALTGLTGLSLLATAVSSGDPTVVYYSTATRAAELLAGAIVAVVAHLLAGRPVRPVVRGVAGVSGGAGLVALVWLCVATSLGTEGYYSGGLTGLAVLSVLVIVGGTLSPTLVRALSWRPLVWLGGVSYGVYLIHWPLVVAVDELEISGWLAPWLVLASTLVLAAVSLRRLEEPVQQRRVPANLLAATGATLAVLIVFLAVAGLERPRRADEIDFRAAAEAFAAVEDAHTARADDDDTGPDDAPGGPVAPDQPGEAPPTSGSIDLPIRVAVFGDSTALMLGLGIGGGDPRLLGVGGSADLGCPIGRGGDVRGGASVGDDPRTPAFTPPDTCGWHRWADAAGRTGGPDVAVVLAGSWDVSGRRVPALGTSWHTVGDEPYDRWLHGEVSAAVDALHEAGVRHVVWMSLPEPGGGPPGERIAAFNDLVEQIASTRPWMTVADYAGYLERSERGDELLPDGIHLTAETAATLSREWLNDLIVAALQP